MNIVSTIIWFVIIFGIVVLSHEFGHFLLAKKNGIHVVEFSVGMGPTIFSFTKKETKYALKLLPLGGACMFEGEDGLETENGGGEGSFTKATVWARIATVVAGPIFNFILAFIFATIIVSYGGYDEPVLSDVAEGYSAEAEGMQAGDRIVRINGKKIYLWRNDAVLERLLSFPALQLQCRKGRLVIHEKVFFKIPFVFCSPDLRCLRACGCYCFQRENGSKGKHCLPARRRTIGRRSRF